MRSIRRYWTVFGRGVEAAAVRDLVEPGTIRELLLGGSGRRAQGPFRPRCGGSAAGTFFRALGIDLVQGRDFVEADWRASPRVSSPRPASQLFDGLRSAGALQWAEPGRAPANVRSSV
jgi:hypothetical protein